MTNGNILASILCGLLAWCAVPAAVHGQAGDSSSAGDDGFTIEIGIDDGPAVESQPAGTGAPTPDPAAPAGDGAAGAPPHDMSAPDSLQDSLAQITTMPALTEFVKADYPAELVKDGVEGVVVLDLVVSDSGRVDSAAVVSGLHPLLDSAALDAARGFLFTPAMIDTQPVAVILQYEYRFTLDEVIEPVKQYVNLSGRVLERGTRAPLPDAMVILAFTDTAADTSLGLPFGRYLEQIGAIEGQYLEEGRLVTVTDSLGRFAFTSLPVGPVAVRIPVTGYEDFTENETIARSEATEATYYIQRISYDDYEIVVYGKTEKKEVARRTLTLNEVRKVPGLGGDAVKVVQALPGVARAAFSSGAVIVRGSGSGDTRYFLDGVTLPTLFHFGGLKSTYNSDALATVDLYPGGFGARYGSAIGGIVEITGRRPKTDRLHGYLDGNLFDASFMVEGPIIKGVTFLATARRSYIANVLSFVLEQVLDVSQLFTVVPFYWDYIVRTDIDLVKNHHFYLTGFGSKDRMDLVRNEVRGGSQDIDEQTNGLQSENFFHLGIFGWDWVLTPALSNRFRYSINRSSAGVSAFGFFKLDNTSLSHYIRDQLSWQASPRLTWNFGLDFQIIPFDLELTIPNVQNEIIKDTTEDILGPFGGYVEAEWKPVPAVTVIPGLRYDYYPELDYDGSLVPEFWNYRSFDNSRGVAGEPALRLSAKWEYMKNHRVKGSAGTYSQAPGYQAIHEKWGNPRIPVEKASQYVLGYEWQITDLISADLQGYFNTQWDCARSVTREELSRDANTPLFIGDGRARMFGMELLLRHDQGKRFFGWLSYSLARSERYDVQNEQWELYSQDQTNNLQLIGSLRFKGNRELGARARYVTGNPTTPVLGVKYFDITNRFYQPLRGETNSERVDPYFSVDLRYERKFAFRNWLWIIYLDIQNLSNLFGYGYKSPELGQYIWNYDYTDKQVLSSTTLPALGLRFEF